LAEVTIQIRKRCFRQGGRLKVKNYVPSLSETKILELKSATELNGRPARTWTYNITEKGGELILRALTKEELRIMGLLAEDL